MSKLVKALLERDIGRRLSGAGSCVVVNYQGLSGPEAVRLRRTLKSRGVRMMVVKNALARRALAEGPLAPACALLDGPSAICWGGADAIDLARVVEENAGKGAPLVVRGGSVEGRALSAEEVDQLARLPGKAGMLAGLAALAMSPARHVVALVLAPARTLAGQIKVLAEDRAN